MGTVIIGIVVLVLIIFVLFTKDQFYNIKKDIQDDYTEYNRPSVHVNQVVSPKSETISDLAVLLKEIVNTNGPLGGANNTVSQNKYDLIFKDVLVCSDKRNFEKYPNPNNYYIHLNVKINCIYKAELIDVYIPAATDDAVNITTTANRLYFSYINTCIEDCEPARVDGYIEIQAGTFVGPSTLAQELTRQFNIVLSAAGINTKCKGIQIKYDKNFNRYIIKDIQYTIPATVIIYAANGFVLSPNSVVVNSIAKSLMLDASYYVSGPKTITLVDENLVVSNAQPGDYGTYNGRNVPLNTDCLFSNSIISNLVLTHCKLYLSLGKLNGDTCNITPDESGTDRNVPPIFCQIPNNTTVSSASVKTLLNQPHNFSAIQFYNPCISKLTKFEIKWYTDSGTLVNILDHCFTLRIYYFQKRIDTTDFSYAVP
jgi:hypothetical protein